MYTHTVHAFTYAIMCCHPIPQSAPIHQVFRKSWPPTKVCISLPMTVYLINRPDKNPALIITLHVGCNSDFFKEDFPVNEGIVAMHNENVQGLDAHVVT